MISPFIFFVWPKKTHFSPWKKRDLIRSLKNIKQKLVHINPYLNHHQNLVFWYDVSKGLIKSVAQGIPSYSVGAFLIPTFLCDEIEKMINSFYWGSKKNGCRGINWLWRDKLTHPHGRQTRE